MPLGSSLRSFFRYAAQQGWCRAISRLGIDLPRLYALEDVPRAPTIDEVDQLLEATASGNDPVTIRDHAILSLLIHYGLRRGEVERLTLDDLDWVAETIRSSRDRSCAGHRPIRFRRRSARPSCAICARRARGARTAPCSSPSRRHIRPLSAPASAPWCTCG